MSDTEASSARAPAGMNGSAERAEAGPTQGWIGADFPRLEDGHLLRGTGRFVGDVHLPGQLSAVIVRSAFAHGEIHKIDVSEAARMAGVVDVVTASDLPEGVGRIPVRISDWEGIDRALQPPLASDRVRYVGEPVAVVVARDRYVAEDAAEQVVLEIEDKGIVTDPSAALSPDAPVLHDAIGSNLLAHLQRVAPQPAEPQAGAHTVLEATFETDRHSAVPMETRGVVADWNESSGRLTLYGITKVSHFNRDVLARMLRIPEQSIHCIEGDVGGGFGVRGELYPEDVLISWLAMRVARPVSWIEDRREHMISANHSRQQLHRVTVRAEADGKIVSFHTGFETDMGAYTRTHGVTVPSLTAALLPGPYDLGTYSYDALCVLTNKTPIGTYRGPGRFEAAFVRERVMDRLARQLGLSPIEVRRRNLISKSRFPYETGLSTLATEVIYDSGDYEGQLDALMAYVDLGTTQAWMRRLRDDGRYVGMGLGLFVEKSGLGPFEGARVRVDVSGRATVYTGVSSLGQGVVTVLAQICAEKLNIHPQDVTVVHGETALFEYGFGSFASRATVMAGNAVALAAEAVGNRAVAAAARVLGVDRSRTRLGTGGRILVDGEPRLTLGEIAERSGPSGAARGGSPGLEAEEYFFSEHMTYPYGAHLAIVEIDVETGGIDILRYVIAYDVGRAVNPTLVRGQIVGGAAQGIGGALYERFVFDEWGQPLATSFMDYVMPGAREMPAVEVLLTEDSPAPHNPLNVKGAGEGGTVGCGAAIANAVEDALSDLGVNINSLPILPEKLVRAVKEAGARPVPG